MSIPLNERPRIPAASIKKAAAAVGFSLCGIAPYRRITEHSGRLSGWLGSGSHGSLGYMERDPARRVDPREVFPGTESVVVCAVNYRNSAWDAPDDGRPKIASYAFSPDYHDSIKKMLRQMMSLLQQEHPGLRGRGITDTAPLLEKAWAVEAGLGWAGRNSLLVTPQYGSAMMLGELLINAVTDIYDEPYPKEGCGNCRRCIDVCPNGAIRGDRTIDASRCISRLTIEPGADELFRDLRTGGESPESAEEPAGVEHFQTTKGAVPLSGWIFGCDECQKCCPHNRAKPLAVNPYFQPVIDPGSLDTARCRDLGLEEFTELFKDSPLERPGLEKVFDRLKSIAAPFDNEPSTFLHDTPREDSGDK